ncbi:hypothetical protein LINPERHAP1_LOCUS28596 [Linum perenne]
MLSFLSPMPKLW